MRGLWRAHRWTVASGALLGLSGALLAVWGNPVNTGICISCFLENAAGALGLHGNPRMQYIRPELLGFFLGSAAAAVLAREFRARARGPGLHLLGLGFLMAVGSAVFIGCPVKAMLRLAGGDLTAVAGAVGLVAGVRLGIALLGRGELGLGGPERPAPVLVPAGVVVAVAVLAGLAFVPGALIESRTGGGAQHAPAAVSLVAGLVLGAACQRTRFCITGAVRDAFLLRAAAPAAAVVAVVAAAVLVNAFTGSFSVGYYDQPGAHLQWAWSALGMGLVGLVAVIAGGCPFRQIIRAGEGDLDAATVCVGMVLGAALVQSWGLGGTTAGVPPAGRVAVLLGLAGVLGLALTRKERIA